MINKLAQAIGGTLDGSVINVRNGVVRCTLVGDVIFHKDDGRVILLGTVRDPLSWLSMTYFYKSGKK